MGRFLDPAFVRDVGRQTDVQIALRDYYDPTLRSDFRNARSSLSSGTAIPVLPLGSRLVAGYALMRDAYGRPALIVRASVTRAVYQEGQRSIRALLLALLIVGLAIGGLSLLALQRGVLSRLSRLRAEVRRVGEGGDASARVAFHGHDELAEVAQTINTTLQALQDLQRERNQIEERHHAVVEQASEGIFLIDVDTWQVLEANPAGRRLLGDGVTETLGLDEMLLEDPAALRAVVDSLIRLGDPLSR